jgi:hypothetical protein
LQTSLRSFRSKKTQQGLLGGETGDANNSYPALAWRSCWGNDSLFFAHDTGSIRVRAAPESPLALNFAMNINLLDDRKEVVDQPVKDQSRRKIKEEERKDDGHKHEHLGLHRVHGGRR